MRFLRGFALALSVATFVVGAAQAAPSDPFKGLWTSIDTDGSNQILALGGGGSTRQLTLRDDYATSCGGGVAVVRGTGTLSGATLSGTFHVRCANGTPIADHAISYVYDSTTNTLTDTFGVVWSR